MKIFTATSTIVPVFSVALLLSISSFPSEQPISLKRVELENPVVDVTPIRLPGSASLAKGSIGIGSCERIKVGGISRLKLGSYASTHRVTLVPSVVIPERLHSQIQICFHQNASLGFCQCEEDKWKPVQKGVWYSVKSPYEDKYIDVNFIGEVSDSVTVTVEEEFQHWRLVCLALGFVLLLLAPIISSWVPFYYSSSMVIGVLLVIIILLFQGMKLLPTGRKSIFYLTIYGSVIGAGSFLLHQFSMLVNSILVNFGLSEEMYNFVSLFVLVGIIIAGAALGYWIVRKFVISKDGSVDVGIAQFVKWSICIIAFTFIFQSTVDTPLAMGALGSCLAICFCISNFKRTASKHLSYSGSGFHCPQRGEWVPRKHNSAEFLSRSVKKSPRSTVWNSPRSIPAWSDSPVKGLMSPSAGKSTSSQQDYYSTFHKTPRRKKFSKKEWHNFTQESTQHAVGELASSSEFTDWIIKNAERIQLRNDSSDETTDSGSESTDENAVKSRNPAGLFRW